MKALGYIDGRIVELDQKVVLLEDRGYQFGDGVYEVTKVHQGRLIAFEAHMFRLYRSLRELRIPVTYTMEEFQEMHEQLIRESGIADGAIYLQLTRGAAPRSHAFPKQSCPVLTMTIRPQAQTEEDVHLQGVSALVLDDIRWLRCDIKSLNLLPNILGKQEAKEAGCYEAVLVRDGKITEGTSSNCFVVKDEVLWTHPLNNLILPGITRQIVLDRIAKPLGLAVLEKAVTPEFAYGADEVFLTGTSTEVMPIVKLGRQTIGNGKPGALTLRLLAEYRKLVQEGI
ncbi:D-amino-acid transaminase [Anaeroarcus burkinensis]|uniref:D-amino-acid transaminase n=1 Tax=Anaeroarcus burkinensis TaxID=82376 RepID=UPI00041FEF3F|nr:D-amino-acid transaminase [Anaeroarcus burkinensis]